MKRLLSILLVCSLLFIYVPTAAYAKAKQMEDGVPVWTEETIRQYALDYIEGLSMDRLWGYFDLQIRRYMPDETFESLLGDLEWMTGDFVALGSYRSFSDPEQQLKTHVLHLCMEKQDLDLYFTHKDQEDDWEVMAIEFVPAEKEAVPSTAPMLVGEEETDGYTVEKVTIGSAAYPLEGELTIPDSAETKPVPVCIMIHDFGPLDRDCTIGKTALFKDMTDTLIDMNVATLRYDKRSFSYPDAPIDTVREEVIEDALSAIALVKQDPRFDPKRIVLICVGFGALIAPRIAVEANGDVGGLVLIGGTSDTLLEVEYGMRTNEVDDLPKEEASVVKNAVRTIGRMKEEQARSLTLFERNGYYYWEAEANTSYSKLKKLEMPIYIIQGENDPHLPDGKGIAAYKKTIGSNKNLYVYQSFHNLNHLLMNDLTVNENGQPEYSVEAHLDPYAGMCIGRWIHTFEIDE